MKNFWQSPRTWLVIGTITATLNFWLVTRADCFVGFWQLIDLFDWMR